MREREASLHTHTLRRHRPSVPPSSSHHAHTQEREREGGPAHCTHYTHTRTYVHVRGMTTNERRRSHHHHRHHRLLQRRRRRRRVVREEEEEESLSIGHSPPLARTGSDNKELLLKPDDEVRMRPLKVSLMTAAEIAK